MSYVPHTMSNVTMEDGSDPTSTMHSDHADMNGVSFTMTSNGTSGELFSSHNAQSLRNPMPNSEQVPSQHDEHGMNIMPHTMPDTEDESDPTTLHSGYGDVSGSSLMVESNATA